jgi:hypothetical protein
MIEAGLLFNSKPASIMSEAPRVEINHTVFPDLDPSVCAPAESASLLPGTCSCSHYLLAISNLCHCANRARLGTIQSGFVSPGVGPVSAVERQRGQQQPGSERTEGRKQYPRE